MADIDLFRNAARIPAWWRRPLPILIACCVLAAMWSVPAYTVEVPPAARQQQVWGYYPWWLPDNWRTLDLSVWDRVLLVELRIGEEGKLTNANGWPDQWKELGERVRQCGGALDLSFTLLDDAKFEHLFSNSQRRMKLLQEIVFAMQQGNAQGVHLDVEVLGRVSQKSISGFRLFVAQLDLQWRRKKQGRIVSVFATVGSPQDLLDKAAFRHIDYVIVQGYDAHGSTSPVAGVVAPLKGSNPSAWPKALQTYRKHGIPPARMLFSVPYFGYEWPVVSIQPGAATRGVASTLSYAAIGEVPGLRTSALAQVAKFGLQRDADSGSPYYVYEDSEGFWQGWFDDEVSMTEKFDFVLAQKLGGVAAFTIGYDAGRFDVLLNKKFGKRPACAMHPAASIR